MYTKLTALVRAYGSYAVFTFFAVYLGYSASQAAVRNYSSQQEIGKLQQQLEVAKQERTRLESLVVYYRTDAYKEKELRRALLLVRPGEAVYALPESSKVAELDIDARAAGTEQGKSSAVVKPNWKLWVEELF